LPFVRAVFVAARSAGLCAGCAHHPGRAACHHHHHRDEVRPRVRLLPAGRLHHLRHRLSRPVRDLLEPLRPAIPAELQPALEGLRQLREHQGFLFGASLARLFERTGGDSIDAIADRIEADAPEVLAEVESWGPGVIDLYRSSFKPTVVGILRALEAAGFEQWWRETLQPGLQFRAREIADTGLASIPIAAELERWSGKPARPGPITLYPVYFMLHQGQQIMFKDQPGLVYLAWSNWPLGDFSLQLIHEVAHNQLLDWSDPAVIAAAATLGQDPYFASVFEGQKVTSGYVVMTDFVEENVTEAAQMKLAPALGVAVDPKRYLRGHDGGSHVLSAALLQVMADQGWAPGGAETFQAFFLRMVGSGALGPGTVLPLRDRFFE
jgi:hypothetical protein